MAPIDCTGVSSAAGLRWFCKHCCSVHRDKLECRYYHHYHHPVLTVPNSNKPTGIPPMVHSVNGGVFCKVLSIYNCRC